jgi:parvulin-like peptidyl-prolyl isomerase
MSKSRKKCINSLIAIGPLVAVSLSACGREPMAPKARAASAEAAPASVAPPPVPSEPTRSYPPGPWRADPGVLNHTMLWLSHILIRHGEGAASQVAFNLTGWQTAQPPVTRTREEARVLAAQLAARARAQGDFEGLARQYSEDLETRTRGGSLGGLIAGHLSAWPEVLDALSTMRVGDVSDAIETEYGFHVVQRRAPVPEAIVSGSHIVIAHSNAPWLRLAARGELPERTREEALAIAQRLYEQLRDTPDEFAKLVAEYSEHRDAVRGGDFGSWSTREISGYPREIETLSQLEVDAVAEPIDSMFGIQVIRRTENRARQHYAMAKISFSFERELPDSDPRSKRAAFEKARGVAAALRKDPGRFSKLQEEQQSMFIWPVIEGRSVPALEIALARLRPGQIADQPIDDIDIEYLIPKRLELSALPQQPEPAYDLPAPAPAPRQ